jgi:hypothetical protein
MSLQSAAMDTHQPSPPPLRLLQSRSRLPAPAVCRPAVPQAWWQRWLPWAGTRTSNRTSNRMSNRTR